MMAGVGGFNDGLFPAPPGDRRIGRRRWGLDAADLMEQRPTEISESSRSP